MKCFREARRGKRNTVDENVFEQDLIRNLINLRDTIMRRQYYPSRGIAFVIKQPVVREIFAAPFRDRVVHHLLFRKQSPWWEKHFIYDSYSCRKGKGTLFGVKRIAHHIKSASNNYQEKIYVASFDLSGYFMSLPRTALYERIKWGLKRQYPNGGTWYEVCSFLWERIIMDDPVEGVRRRGKMSLWDIVPSNKSLFLQPDGVGIVIGNLTSQLLSNIYLDMLDQFVTKVLKYKHYGRYVDDFIIIVKAEELPKLKQDVKVIQDYLKGIGLTMHPHKCKIQEANKGTAFLGAVIYPWGIVPGRRLHRNIRDAVKKVSVVPKDRWVTSMVSYQGHTCHYKDYRFWWKIFDEMGWDYQD